MIKRPAISCRFLVLLIPILAVVGCGVSQLVSPSDRVAVKIRNTDTTAYFEMWQSGLSGFSANARVENRRGSASATIWRDIDLDGRPSFYLTPARQIAVITGLGDVVFAIPSGAPPSVLHGEDRPPGAQSAEWTYLGAVVRREGGSVFLSPSQAPECIPLYGEGSTPYRQNFATDHSCPK